MTVHILQEKMNTTTWQHEYVEVPAPRAKERLARKLVKAERTGIESAYEVSLKDWDVTVHFQDVIARITWKNPRTNATFCSHGIYYEDNGDVLHSEWAVG